MITRSPPFGLSRHVGDDLMLGIKFMQEALQTCIAERKALLDLVDTLSGEQHALLTQASNDLEVVLGFPF